MVVVLSVLVVGLPAHALDPTPGAPGVGDTYFPAAGNGGYDVTHYDVGVDYGIALDRLDGNTRIEATATQDLSSFNLDLRLTAQNVVVDGVIAAFSQTGQEVTVTPGAPILQGQAFVVEVQYGGHPGALPRQGRGGWVLTDDGAVAAGEPEAATTWFPSNDHPSDKATFDIRATVSATRKAISNGELVEVLPAGDQQEWHWRVDEPMAPHATMLVVGDYTLSHGTSPGGVPWVNAVSGRLGDRRRFAATRSLRATPGIVDLFSRHFGPYPFAVAGGVVASTSAGASFASQTRPVHPKGRFGEGRRGVRTGIVVRELAHQWWGDSVSVRQWQDSWLSEGFAAWSTWLWQSRRGPGRPSLNAAFARAYASLKPHPRHWLPRLADPGREHLFDPAVATRGALALQALRNRIGIGTHAQLLRAWAADHADGNGSVADFEALAEQVSGEQLDMFFTRWLHSAGRPHPSAVLGFPPSMLGGGSHPRG